METYFKRMVYFNPHFPTQESVAVLQCGYQESSSGHVSTQRIAEDYVLHCITSGKGTYTIYGKKYYLEKGDCFLLVPGVPLLYQADVKDPWFYYWIGFRGLSPLSLLSLCGIEEHTPVVHFDAIERAAHIIKPLTYADPGLLSTNYFAIGQFYRLCSLFIENNKSNRFSSRKEFFVEQVVAYICNSYSAKITVQGIAQHIGLDRTYLYRIFKEVKGVSIQTYLLQFRLNRACHFLAHSTLSLEEISICCGFSSCQHFSSLFKKHMGITPSEYRRTNQK